MRGVERLADIRHNNCSFGPIRAENRETTDQQNPSPVGWTRVDTHTHTHSHALMMTTLLRPWHQFKVVSESDGNTPGLDCNGPVKLRHHSEAPYLSVEGWVELVRGWNSYSPL